MRVEYFPNKISYPSSWLLANSFLKPQIRKKFSALMVSLDTGVQQLTEALKSRNMYDNTIFIFTGDNGGKGHV